MTDEQASSETRTQSRAMLKVVLILALSLHVAALKASVLSKALKRKDGRPLIVHLWDANPSALETFAIDDVSEACRKAGASAVLTAPALVSSIAQEQERQRGSFPGPLPVISDCALNDLDSEVCAGAKNLGASAIGIRYYLGDYETEDDLEARLSAAVTAADESGRACRFLASNSRCL